MATRDPVPGLDAPPAVGLIELDLGTPWEPDESPLPARRRARGRWMTAVAVLAGVLLGAGGSTVHRSLDAVFHLQGGVRGIVGASGLLTVLRQSGNGAYSLTAYRVGDFSTAWRQSAIGDFVWASDGFLVVGRYGAGIGGDELLVLDAATGRITSTHRGASLLGSTDTVLLTAQVPPDADLPVDPVEASGVGRAPVHVITGTDWRTGEVRWSVRTPVGAHIGTTDRADPARQRFIEIDDDGRTTLRDMTTGAVVRSTTITGPVSGDLIFADDDMVLLGGVDDGTANPGTSGLSGFSLSDGRLRWQRADLTDGYLTGCGRLLCQFAADSTVAVDPASGLTRWQLDWVGWTTLTGTDLILGRDRGERSGVAIADTATGRIRASWAHWRPAPGGAPGRQVVMQADDLGNGNLGVLDVRRRRLDLVGTVPGGLVGMRDLSCVPVSRYLACVGGRSMAVWPW